MAVCVYLRGMPAAAREILIRQAIVQEENEEPEEKAQEEAEPDDGENEQKDKSQDDKALAKNEKSPPKAKVLEDKSKNSLEDQAESKKVSSSEPITLGGKQDGGKSADNKATQQEHTRPYSQTDIAGNAMNTEPEEVTRGSGESRPQSALGTNREAVAAGANNNLDLEKPAPAPATNLPKELRVIKQPSSIADTAADTTEMSSSAERVNTYGVEAIDDSKENYLVIDEEPLLDFTEIQEEEVCDDSLVVELPDKRPQDLIIDEIDYQAAEPLYAEYIDNEVENLISESDADAAPGVYTDEVVTDNQIDNPVDSLELETIKQLVVEEMTLIKEHNTELAEHIEGINIFNALEASTKLEGISDTVDQLNGLSDIKSAETEQLQEELEKQIIELLEILDIESEDIARKFVYRFFRKHLELITPTERQGKLALAERIGTCERKRPDKTVFLNYVMQLIKVKLETIQGQIGRLTVRLAYDI